eukprot:TRINITY_DN27262_c0_g5_i1.p1 TRINITY_DN27262_c0_g5~~TRINITY_DN27262_c0_g5_i1.p1  ORF type:complete len:963 (+),score=290.02 TRINITY_DN27262_c0_g5_i1:98-2890(+)
MGAKGSTPSDQKQQPPPPGGSAVIEQHWALPRLDSPYKAVLVGITYNLRRGSHVPLLPGCGIDARNYKSFLPRHGFVPSGGCRVLTDDGKGDLAPTKRSIIDALHWMVLGAQPGHSFFLMLSGNVANVHPDGTAFPSAATGADAEGEQPAGEQLPQETALVPSAWEGDAQGLVREAEVAAILSHLPKGCRLTVVCDTLNPGAPLTLPWGLVCVGGARRRGGDPREVVQSLPCDALMLCSARKGELESYPVAGCGALCSGLIHALDRTRGAPRRLGDLLQEVAQQMERLPGASAGKSPVFSSNAELDVSTFWQLGTESTERTAPAAGPAAEAAPGLRVVITKTADGKVGMGYAGEGQVTVTRITPGSPAEQAGLREGMQLLQVSGQRVVDAAHAEQLFASVAPGSQFAVLAADPAAASAAASSGDSESGGGVTFHMLRDRQSTKRASLRGQQQQLQPGGPQRQVHFNSRAQHKGGKAGGGGGPRRLRNGLPPSVLVTDIDGMLGLSLLEPGLRVVGVQPGTAAERAGLQRYLGCRLMYVDGVAVGAESDVRRACWGRRNAILTFAAPPPGGKRQLEPKGGLLWQSGEQGGDWMGSRGWSPAVTGAAAGRGIKLSDGPSRPAAPRPPQAGRGMRSVGAKGWLTPAPGWTPQGGAPGSPRLERYRRHQHPARPDPPPPYPENPLVNEQIRILEERKAAAVAAEDYEAARRLKGELEAIRGQRAAGLQRPHDEAGGDGAGGSERSSPQPRGSGAAPPLELTLSSAGGHLTTPPSAELPQLWGTAGGGGALLTPPPVGAAGDEVPLVEYRPPAALGLRSPPPPAPEFTTPPSAAPPPMPPPVVPLPPPYAAEGRLWAIGAAAALPPAGRGMRAPPHSLQAPPRGSPPGPIAERINVSPPRPGGRGARRVPHGAGGPAHNPERFTLLTPPYLDVVS